MKLYKCSNCKGEKPREEFFKNGARSLGIGSLCKVCDSKKQKERNRKKYFATYKGGNKEKIQAKEAVRYAVRVGKIKKELCSKCKIIDVEAHHYKGYEKENWFEIMWLCHKHHMQMHSKY